MKGVVLLLVLMLAACSQTSPAAARPSSSPLATPLSASSSSSPVATPTPFDLDPPLTTLSFSCRLPITTPNLHGAFISFPAATVTFDPQGQGNGAEGWGLYYDRAFSRWLPVPRQAVSPDGKHYAYGQRPPDRTKFATMHVVDVATGADHVFETPPMDFIAYTVLDYASEGIYLYTTYEVSFGLWLMDPATGVIRNVAQLMDLQASAGNRTFWVGTVNPADPHPLGGIGIQPNQIDRFSLADGTRVPWFYRPSTAPRVIGSDTQGHPIVLAVNGKNGSIDADYGAEILVLIDPQTQRSIFKGTAKIVNSMFVTITDSHGTWFGTDHGIYLHTGTAFIKVSNQPGYPAQGCF